MRKQIRSGFSAFDDAHRGETKKKGKETSFIFFFMEETELVFW